jgi:hypothetical protein
MSNAEKLKNLIVNLNVVYEIRNNLNQSQKVETAKNTDDFLKLVNSNNFNENEIRNIEDLLQKEIQTQFNSLYSPAFETNSEFIKGVGLTLSDAIYLLSTNSRYNVDLDNIVDKQNIQNIAIELIDILRDEQFRNPSADPDLYTSRIQKLQNYIDVNNRAQLAYLKKLHNEYNISPKYRTLNYIKNLKWIILNNIQNFYFRNPKEIYGSNSRQYLIDIGKKIAYYMDAVSDVDTPIDVNPEYMKLEEETKEIAYTLFEAFKNEPKPSSGLDIGENLRKLIKYWYKLEKKNTIDIDELINNMMILIEKDFGTF